MKSYTDDMQAEFCALAQEIGIGRARRELGYPSYPAAVKWMNARGIKPNVDQLMQKAKEYHTFYQTDDLLMAVDNGMAVVEDLFATAANADDAKKLAEALQKLANTRLLLEGKATQVTEKRDTTPVDLEIQQLIKDMENSQ